MESSGCKRWQPIANRSGAKAWRSGRPADVPGPARRPLRLELIEVPAFGTGTVLDVYEPSIRTGQPRGRVPTALCGRRGVCSRSRRRFTGRSCHGARVCGRRGRA
jgi:hypothetical protein